MQYPADREVFKVAWFHQMMTQVPESWCSQDLTFTRNMWGHFRYLLASITLGTVYQHQFKQVSF